jgi:hypothetical protein
MNVRAQVSGLASVLDTTSHRPPSCWTARIPIAFSPSVRASPTLEDSNRLRATSAQAYLFRWHAREHRQATSGNPRAS